MEDRCLGTCPRDSKYSKAPQKEDVKQALILQSAVVNQKLSGRKTCGNTSHRSYIFYSAAKKEKEKKWHCICNLFSKSLEKD